MSKLIDYVLSHTERGECICGKCCDSLGSQQPDGHTVDLTFFKVKAINNADAKEFLALINDGYSNLLDGKEYNYLTLGGILGSQEAALMTIGLGHLLGIWSALTPEIMMPFLSKDLKLQMARCGMVALQKKRIK